jgi:hypothetical protein
LRYAWRQADGAPGLTKILHRSPDRRLATENTPLLHRVCALPRMIPLPPERSESERLAPQIAIRLVARPGSVMQTHNAMQPGSTSSPTHRARRRASRCHACADDPWDVTCAAAWLESTRGASSAASIELAIAEAPPRTRTMRQSSSLREPTHRRRPSDCCSP